MGVRLGRGRGEGSPKNAQRILGVDPGTVVTGWGVVEIARGSLVHIAHGTITTSGNVGQGKRLGRIYHALSEVFQRYQPEAVSLEKVFFARNAQSALKLGQARGVVLLAAAEHGLPLHEYASTEIKQAVVGYGRAAKEQVGIMVASLLRVVGQVPTDAADALAAAICHLHQQTFSHRVVEAIPILGRPEKRRWTLP
jgi:crossover junction endodeoxyribonuclease RuvC